MRPLPHRWETLYFPLLLLTAGIFLPVTALAMFEQTFLYFPEREITLTPATAGLSYEEVFFPAADGTRLHGWYLHGSPGRPLVLFFHGNAGNISHRVENLSLFHRELGVPVFIFDYRGYGRSDGEPGEEGTYADARGALAWLRQQGWEPARMVYFGRSLGAAVAVQLALEAPPAGLVLESPFPSVAALGRYHYSLLYHLLGWALDARYDSAAKIGRLRLPLLMFQGDRDGIVPPDMARRLFARANEPKTFHLIPGAGHNDTLEYGDGDYWEGWRRFLEQIKAGASPAGGH